MIIVIDEVGGAHVPNGRQPTHPKIVNPMTTNDETSSTSEGTTTTGTKTWVTFLKLVLECIVAALTALGVASCTQVVGA